MRNERLNVPVTEHESRALEWVARKRGLSKSALLRLESLPAIVAEYDRDQEGT